MNMSKPYYIGETAFHHEGDVDFLKKLITDISNIEVQAIKFHLLFDVEDYMVPEHSAIDVIKKIVIPEGEWESIFSDVKKQGKEIVALTNDLKSLEFINKIQDEYPISAIELHSSGLNDIFLLEEAINFNKTVMIGVGGSSFDEIKFSVDFLTSKGKKDILLMHGFQNYPTSYEDINFNRIKFYQDAFSLQVGYADHTDPNDSENSMISVLPAIYGVKVFEKHITNVLGEKRIDAQSAIGLETMKDVIIKGNAMHKTLGTSNLEFSEAELNYGDTGPMKKALVARETIEEGKIIQLNDVAYKRIEESSSLNQKDILKLIGSKAIKKIEKNELLTFAKIEYSFKKQSNDQFFIKR